MNIECPSCNARYKIDPGQTTKTLVTIKCPKCSVTFKLSLGGTGQAPDASPVADKTKILVVDDARFFRELILDLLKPLGMSVLTASDGVEALKIIVEQKPSLVLLDLNLPKMNGYDLIKAVRADASIPENIYLLAMSGVVRKEEDVRKIERAGADDFMNKSFTPDEFLARIRKIIHTD